MFCVFFEEHIRQNYNSRCSVPLDIHIQLAKKSVGFRTSLVCQFKAAENPAIDEVKNAGNPKQLAACKKREKWKKNKSIVRCWHIQQGFHGNCTQVILFEPSKNIWTRISELLNKRPVLGWLEVFFVVYMLYLKL